MKDLTPCDAVWDLLSLYADGEADAGDRKLVEQHVSTCEACALDLLFLRETATVLADAPLIAPPPNLKQAILAATIYRPTWQERLRETLAGALPPSRVRLAGAVAATLLVVAVMARTREQSPVEFIQRASSGSPVASRAGTGLRDTVRIPAHENAIIRNSDRMVRSAQPAAAVRQPRFSEDRSRKIDRAVADVAVRLASAGARPATVAAKSTPASPTSQFAIRRAARATIAPRVASNVPAPRVVDEQPLNEPAGVRDSTVVAFTGGNPVPTSGAGTGGNLPGNTGTQPATPPAERPHYTLTASTPSGGADALVSFADLRSALRKRNESARTVAMDFDQGDRRATLDVYKSRF